MEKVECLESFIFPLQCSDATPAAFYSGLQGSVCSYTWLLQLRKQLWIDPEVGKSFCCTGRGIQRMVKVLCQGLRDSHFISEFVLDLVICQCFGCCLVPMKEEFKAFQTPLFAAGTEKSVQV